ncbi:hypothetical protein [Sphingobacterium siyangense]
MENKKRRQVIQRSALEIYGILQDFQMNFANGGVLLLKWKKNL